MRFRQWRWVEGSTLRASPLCETTILLESKRSQTILNLKKTDLLLTSSGLGQGYKLRPTYCSSKYLKIIIQDNKQLNQCILCITFSKYFLENLKAIYFLKIFIFIYLFIWLHWVLVAACRIS